MQQIDTIVVVHFPRDPDERHTKVWKQLGSTQLEQRMGLPVAVLAPGNLLELSLDADIRELRIDYVRWEHPRQTMHVHVVPTEALAGHLRETGLSVWRPWLHKRVVEGFLERCRRSGWNLRGAVGVPLPPVRNGGDRVEPTL